MDMDGDAGGGGERRPSDRSNTGEDMELERKGHNRWTVDDLSFSLTFYQASIGVEVSSLNPRIKARWRFSVSPDGAVSGGILQQFTPAGYERVDDQLGRGWATQGQDTHGKGAGALSSSAAGHYVARALYLHGAEREQNEAAASLSLLEGVDIAAYAIEAARQFRPNFFTA